MPKELEKFNQYFKEVLLKGNYVSKEDIAAAEEYAKENNTYISEYLVNNRIIDSDFLGQAIAESCNLPYADLNSHQPPESQILKIPKKIAQKYRLVLFLEDKHNVVVTTDNPWQEDLINIIRELFPEKEAHLAYSLSGDINKTLVLYQASLGARVDELFRTGENIAPQLIIEFLEDALTKNASDIHFEPQENSTMVRVRIDGILHETVRIPKPLYENILNRIKLDSHLRIDMHNATQDGAMRYKSKTGPVDLRVSIIPTLTGEKTALRILSGDVQNFTQKDLGLTERNQKILEKASKKSYGMILTTGPTGSGKTTTLYSIIKKINNPGINITTIEDPVEYKIQGVNQIQVIEETKLTFANGLRSIVRQDPDVILVGEIRDKDTAEIGINAAMTGHLLLSTFHANNAATSIPRLIDMGLEPFLLASTLEIIMAQRLVRKICNQCRISVTVTKNEILAKYPEAAPFFLKDKYTFYKGKGCPACANSGYQNRIGVFEIIRNTPQLQSLILKNPPSKDIWALARSQGALSLFEDGIEKVLSGLTTLEELIRVAPPVEIS